MNIYTQEFMHYYKNQPFKKKLDMPTLIGRESNSSCGDELTVEIVINENKISNIGYYGDGCAICEGSMAILAEHIIDKDVAYVNLMKEKDMLDMLGFSLTVSRKRCAFIGFNAVKDALNYYAKK